MQDEKRKRRHRREIGRRNQRGADAGGRHSGPEEQYDPFSRRRPPIFAQKEKVWYRTSLVLSLSDQVGALQNALKPFSERGLNLCKIESRPSGKKKWDYYFFVDFIGHRDDEKVVEAMQELEKVSFRQASRELSGEFELEFRLRRRGRQGLGQHWHNA